jgi:hypothetical protein
MSPSNQLLHKKRTRKVADLGLSDKERIFVHALRNLFDSKGKGKEISAESKEFCAPKVSEKKPSSAVPKGQASQERRGKATKPYSFSHATKSMSRRAKKRALRMYTEKSGKGSTPAKKSPSEIKRAAWRKVLQPKSDETAFISTDSTRKFHSEPVSRRKGVLEQRKLAFEMRAQDVNAKRRTALSSVTPKAGVIELEVVEAWGGAAALDLLCKRVKTMESSVSWIPNYAGQRFDGKRKTKGRFGKELSVTWAQEGLKYDDDSYAVHVYGRHMRDYTKAVKDCSAQTEKRSTFYGVKKVSVPKGAGSTGKGKQKEEANLKVKSAKSPSQLRRLALRDAKRKADSLQTTVVKTTDSVSPKGDTNAYFALKTICKDLQRVYEGFIDSKSDQARNEFLRIFGSTGRDFQNMFDASAKSKALFKKVLVRGPVP